MTPWRCSGFRRRCSSRIRGSGEDESVDAAGNESAQSVALSVTIDTATPIPSGQTEQIAKLLAGDGAAEDRFGFSVSISGGTAIVGAYRDDDNGMNSGSAYIFEDNGSSWTQVAKLTAGDGAAGDYFGDSVSISGGTAIVGAWGNDGNGSAYIFEDTGSSWTQVAKLTAGDGAAYDDFGDSVSISGGTAIVGAEADDDNGTNSGSAYIFEDTGSSWTQVAKLTAGDGAAYDHFGDSVSISGGTAIVGADCDDDNGSRSGSAYIFEDTGSGWTQVAKLTAGDGTASDYFGDSVSISGGTAIVGAWGNDGNGSAYIFEDTGSSWAQVAKLTAGDGAAGDYFGDSVSISGGTAIVGAPSDDDNGSASGSAYIFEDTGSSWAQVAKLTAGDGAAGDYLGDSVSISGGTAIVGAYFDDDNGANSGSAYVFSMASSNDAPTIAILEGPANGSTIDYDDVTFTWAGSDTDGSVVGYEIKLDGAGQSTGLTSETFHDLSEASHTFEVRAIDDDSAYSPWVSRTFTVDLETDVGDQLSDAMNLGVFSPGTSTEFSQEIGDGLFDAADVDIYRLDLSQAASAEIVVHAQSIGSGLDPYLRLFDGSGIQIGENDDTSGLDPVLSAPLAAGTYYAGVSGRPNYEYAPLHAGRGTDSHTVGDYSISVSFTPGDPPPPVEYYEPIDGLRIRASQVLQATDGTYTATGTVLINDFIQLVGVLEFNERTQLVTGNGEVWMIGLPVLDRVQ